MTKELSASVSLIKVAIAEDYGIIRKTIVQYLKEYDQIKLTHEKENGKELLEAIIETNQIPDIILMDILMPVMDGFETALKIKLVYPNVRILFLTSNLSSDFFEDAISSGGNGFITKDTEFELMIQAIEQIFHRGFYFNEDIDSRVLKGFLAEGKIRASFNLPENLSDTELEFIKQWATELSDYKVAKSIGISLFDVQLYKAQVMKKIGVVNSVGLQVFAIVNKLID